MIEVVLSKIVIRETSENQRIVLREKGGKQRQFPIVIGLYEALAIDRRVRERPSRRPMTHALMSGVITALGAQLDRIVISDLRNNTFHARLELSKEGGERVEVDARPSDAIALAAHLDSPIFVEEDVLEAVLPPSE